ncbi:MAG: hypothetical protein K1X79_09240 [Oligoflexia bacterium]|nr:hypothetical protein [Oligoflexia bacterium]
MPYIKSTERGQYIEAIEEIARLIPTDRTSRPGHLNFVISLLLQKVYGPSMRYADHNEAIGVLNCAALELYRRKTAPYEDEKIASDGDI